MITWKIETRKLKDLREHPKNPRKLSKEQHAHLTQSLKKFGVAEKPIINTDGMIIGGHQRLKVLKELGYKELECWVPSEALTEAQCDEMNIRLNKNIGEFDFDILANEWQLDDLLEWGFTPEEFGIDLNAELADEEGEGSTNDVGKDEDAITKLGDVYDLNNHRLICGSNQDVVYLEKIIYGAEISFCIADPPYNLNFKYVGYDDNQSKSQYKKFCETYVKNALKFCDFMCVTPGNHNEHIYLNENLIEMACWNKKFALTGGRICSALVCEPILFLGKKIKNKKYDTNCFTVSTEREKDLLEQHSCPKPVELWVKLIEPMTDKDDIFLEMFGGSGTSWIAAEKLRRRCFGIEQSPAYCDVIVRRYIKFMTENGRPYEIKRNGEPFECPT